MEVKFKILGSSSSGNSALLQAAGLSILIDAGLSGRKIESLLLENNLSAECLDAIFLTHEHQDHVAGLRGLSKYSRIPVFANRDTVLAIQSKLSRRPNWQIFETGKPFAFRSLDIHPFSVPHDAYDPVGFFFKWGGDDLFNPPSSLAWLTDLGYVPSSVRERIKQAKILVVEANHCSRMLEMDTKRPWSLKQRIRGRHGHLSNKATFELIDSMNQNCWEKIFLMHLSKDCNDIDLVKDSFKQVRGNREKFSTYIVDPVSAKEIPV